MAIAEGTSVGCCWRPGVEGRLLVGDWVRSREVKSTGAVWLTSSRRASYGDGYSANVAV